MTTAARSGGRIASQGDKSRKKTTGAEGTLARGARHFPVRGTAALQLDAEPQRADQARDGVARPRLQVAPPAPINAPRAPFIALVSGVVVVGVLGILLINTKTAENSFKLDSLQKQQSTLDTQQQSLENEIAARNMPGNLDAAARALGLVKADSPAYIRLPDGKIIGVMTPGKGQTSVTAQDPDATAEGSTPAATGAGQTSGLTGIGQQAGTPGAGLTAGVPGGTGTGQVAGATGTGQAAGTVGAGPAVGAGQVAGATGTGQVAGATGTGQAPGAANTGSVAGATDAGGATAGVAGQ
ncbi:hypothetical protein L083_2012 [Actinoplanes sp. N902-109]|nr:hypothetical protein L083_2012 [Actinoplanes sp. N902-109]